MEDHRYRIPQCALETEHSTLFAKGPEYGAQEDSFVHAVLGSLCEKLAGESRETVAKAVANAAFIMLDEIQSRTRYGMKSERERVAAPLQAIREGRRVDAEVFEPLLETYALLLRRARRNRRMMALTLENIVRYYDESGFESLQEPIFFGTRSLAHIDIMISLHEEELKAIQMAQKESASVTLSC